MKDNSNLLELLKYINPSDCDYQEWVNVGMALKHEEYTVFDWDQWSMADPRYRTGECAKKWETFNGSGSPVTAGTIVQMAKDHGWQPPTKRVSTSYTTRQELKYLHLKISNTLW